LGRLDQLLELLMQRMQQDSANGAPSGALVDPAMRQPRSPRRLAACFT
jgi:hypothetical protein